MGPIQKEEKRDQVVKRMINLMDAAKKSNADLIVYPELALTTFFPRYYMEDQKKIDLWFETEMPNAATLPLFKKGLNYGMSFTFGYAELTHEGKHFNTSIFVDKTGSIIGKYRNCLLYTSDAADE